VFRMRASPHLYSMHTHTCRCCSTANFYHTHSMYHCHFFHWITFQLRFVLILFWHVIKASAVTWGVLPWWHLLATALNLLALHLAVLLNVLYSVVALSPTMLSDQGKRHSSSSQLSESQPYQSDDNL